MAINTDTYGNVDEFSSGLKDELDEIFMDDFNDEPFEFEQVMHVGESTEMIRKESQIAYPTRTRTVSEGGAFHRVEMQQIRTKQYVMEFIKTEIKMSREAVRYLQYDELKDASRALSQVLKTTIEELAQSVFCLGFTTMQSPDGVSLFNTLHPLKDPDPGYPSTQSNRSNLRISPDALKARQTAMRLHRNEKGALSKTKADTIIYGPDEEWRVKQCLQKGYEPFSANHTDNIGTDLKPVCLTYIADSELPRAWFLQDSKRHKIKFFWGLKPHQWVDKDPTSADFLYRVEANIMFGNSSYMGIDGNSGEV